MRKFRFLSAVILVLAVTGFVACDSKDDDSLPVYPTENPLTGYLAASGFNQEEDIVTNGAAREFGFSFRPTVSGVITAISVKIPDVNNALKVTVWDVAAGTVVKTETFNVTSSGVAVTKSISALPLRKDKEYMITMNSADYYERSRTDGGDAAYPFTVGNIQVTGSGYSLGGTQTFPIFYPTNYYNGDVSFTFQRIL